VTREHVRIHQALHGYKDGHRLLASSTPIEELADRRLLQTLSDSPDASRIQRDRPLLAGYCLPSGSFYVLAMTWPAPDVKRPGCVWTHSLLLDRHALDLENLVFLLDRFQRPSAGDTTDTYSIELMCAIEHREPSQPSAVEATLLWSLYEPPAPPVEIRAGALEGVEGNELLLSVFSQLWPALRRNYAFAAAPRTARRIEGELLDLQITYTPQAASWEQRPTQAPVRTVTKSLPGRTPEWCEALAADLGEAGPLRSFLRTVGPLSNPSRPSMWALASLWAVLDPAREASSYETVPQLLSTAFGDPDAAVEFLEALFAGNQHDLVPFSVDRSALLVALAPPGTNEAVRIDHEWLRRTGSALLAGNAEDALSFIHGISARRAPGDAATTILAGIAEGLTDTQIRSWGTKDPAALAILAAHSDDLSTRPLLYACTDADALWAKIGRSRAARARRLASLLAILKAPAPALVALARADWPDADALLMEILASADTVPDAERLLNELEPAAVLAWLSEYGPSPQISGILLKAWKPKRLAKVPQAEWKAMLEQGGDLDDLTLARLFAAATDPASGFGPQGAISVYLELLRRLSAGKLSKRALSVLVGASGRERGSSATEIAARMVAEAFLAGDWPAARLLDITEAEVLRLVLAHDPGGSLAGTLLPVLQKKGHASDAQREVVFDAVEAAEEPDVIRSAVRFFRKYFRGA
jgi:hypothetical protein